MYVTFVNPRWPLPLARYTRVGVGRLKPYVCVDSERCVLYAMYGTHRMLRVVGGGQAGINECPAKYGMKRCSDGMFSACRASVFQPLFFVFFIFPRGTHGNAAQRASPRPRLLPSRAAFASHCFSGQLKLESPTFRPSLCSAATPAGRAGTNHPQLHNE
jgi:hypothetical protein